MPALLHEWLNLAVRWVHVIAAIMWVGDSFLFMWLDRNLSDPKPERDGAVAGELWLTHSGGFYEVIKRKSLQKGEWIGQLYWFKWESYTTWISGFLLLCVVYYLGGPAFMVDPAVAQLSWLQAVGCSLGGLVLGLLVYDVLWRTPLAKDQRVFGAVCFAAVLGAAYLYTHLLSGRAAFLQVGAMVGTVMAANVFFVIIPSQRHMVAATLAGTPVDTRYGVRAKGRSQHNHYATLPVLFTMLSSHFPSTYGHPQAWVVLGLIFVAGAALKHVMSFRGRAHPVVTVGGAFALAGAALLTVIANQAPLAGLEQYAKGPRVSFATAEAIVQARCVACHSPHPSNPMFAAPPNGLVFDSPQAIAQHAERMYVRSVAQKSMPLGNLTAQTDEERALFGAWVAQGADVHAAGPVALPTAPATAAAPARSPAEEARARFRTTCAACHGEKGDGQSAAAAALVVKPRDYTDQAWQRSVTDEQLRTVIVEGGQAVGKSPLMPPNPDLKEQPQVVDELVKIVRSFGPK